MNFFDLVLKEFKCFASDGNFFWYTKFVFQEEEEVVKACCAIILFRTENIIFTTRIMKFNMSL